MRKVGFIPVGRVSRVVSSAAVLWLAVALSSAAQGQTPPSQPGFDDQPPPAARPIAKTGNGVAKKTVAAKPPASASGMTGTYAGRTSEVAGRYALIRAGGKDTGCMLTLDDKARGPKGSFKAILGPGCPDQGLLVFDPVGWLIEKGRLALIARAGHQTHYDAQSDGSWMKDPKEGAPLALKKL